MGRRKSWFEKGIAVVLVIALLAGNNLTGHAKVVREAEGQGERTETQADEEGFVIEDGVLTKYTGTATDIVVPDGVTSIYYNAFENCSNLISIKLPESLKHIYSSAFKGCSKLENVEMSKSMVDSIGFSAFEGCSSLKSIKLPDGVTSLGDAAFRYCSSLTEIELPESLEKIGDYSFYFCSNLETVEIPAGVTDMGGLAFYGTKWMTNQRAKNPLVIVNHILIDGNGASGNIVIPEGITKITEHAFSGCTALTNVKLPEGLTKIWDNAFAGCKSLVAMEIPDSVKSIGDKAFEECSRLGSINFPEDLESIGVRAFSKCGDLNGIELPIGLKSVGSFAFSGCDANRIKLPEGITKIWDYTFSGCTGTESLKLPEGITSIGKSAFEQCSLSGIEWPESLANIEARAFHSCNNLTSMKLPGSVTSIGQEAFAWCENLKSIELPKSLNNVELGAFYCCKSLSGINLEEGITEIWPGAFESCISLTNIKLPKSVISIGNRAFAGCSSLSSIELPEGLNNIGEQAFRECKLETFTIGPNVTEIGKRAFEKCNNLTEIFIDEENSNYIALNGNILSKDHTQFIWRSGNSACCVESLTLKPSQITIGEHAYGDMTWGEQENYFKYRVPVGFIRGTLKFIDGVEREGTLQELYEQYEDLAGGWGEYEYTEESDQSSENVWEPGEHSFFVSILDCEPAELKVTILPEDKRTETVSRGKADYKIDWKLLENVGSVYRTYELGEIGILSFSWEDDTEEFADSNENGILLLNEMGDEIARHKLSDLWRKFKGETECEVYLSNASVEGDTYYLLLKAQKQNEEWEWKDVDTLKLSTKDGLSFQEEKEELVEKETAVIEGEECTIWKWGTYTIAVSNSTEKKVNYYVSENGKTWEKRVLPFENRYKAGVLKITDKGVYFYSQNKSCADYARTDFRDFQGCYFTSDLKNFTKVMEAEKEEQWIYTLGANTESGFLILAQQAPSEDDCYYSTALRTCIYQYKEKANALETLWDTYDPVSMSDWTWQRPDSNWDSYSAYDFSWDKEGMFIKTWISIGKGVLDEYVLNVSKDHNDGGCYGSKGFLEEETGITRYKKLDITHYAYFDNIGSIVLSGDYYKTIYELNTPEYIEGDWHVGRWEFLSGCCFYSISYGDDKDMTYIFNIEKEQDSLFAMLDTIYAIGKDGVVLQCTGTAVLNEKTTIAAERKELAKEEMEAYHLGGSKAVSYDVGLYFEGESVNLGNGFQVFMDVPEGFDENKCSVYFVQSDGSRKNMGAKLDEDGNLTFLTTNAGKFVIVEEEALLGDADGDGELTTDDALIVLKNAVGLEETVTKETADMDNDGEITTDDALLVLKYAVGVL